MATYKAMPLGTRQLQEDAGMIKFAEAIGLNNIAPHH